MMTHQTMTIRAATPLDGAALARLARLDCRRLPAGHVLLAETDGEPIAAIGLTSGVVFTDPLNPPADGVCRLRFLRYRLLRQGGDVGMARTLLRRLAATH
jgi:hypothetical protein